MVSIPRCLFHIRYGSVAHVADSESLQVTVPALRKINAVLGFASLRSTEMEVLLHKQLRSPHTEAGICQTRCLVRWAMMLRCDHHLGVRCMLNRISYKSTTSKIPGPGYLFSFSILKKYLTKKPTATTTDKNKTPPSPF